MQEHKPDISFLQREYSVFKHSEGNFRCRRCLIVDGYTKEEKKCRFCGQELFEVDKV
ncbi:MAG: hypothetical protein NC908_00650 [Candidatus Omnitrophica bacterium]|nr:hypothetical protein [Candidatus Omnitrophota bacterium]